MRENTNPEQLYIGDFKGMATSGGSYSADPRFLNYLCNASVTKEGKLKQRSGSRAVIGYDGSGFLFETFAFNFSGLDWFILRDSVNFNVQELIKVNNQPFTTRTLARKTNVLRNASANEPSSYAVTTNGDYCHVLIATASTTLIGLTIIRRDMVVASTPTATSFTASKRQLFSSAINQNNTRIYRASDNACVTNDGATISQSGTTITANNPFAHGLSTGDKIYSFTCFWTRYCDGNIYPGTSVWSSSLRRNSVPLDVNVEVPEPIRSNYILNEPSQDVSQQTIYVYENNGINQSPLSFTPNPSTANQWTFTDGSFRPGVNTPTATANYVGFGALQPGNVNTRMFFARMREFLPSQSSFATTDQYTFTADKANVNSKVRFADRLGNIVSSPTACIYWFFPQTTTASPGVRQDAVVECVCTGFSNAGQLLSQTIVDLDTALDTLVIGDGFVIPLYGYSIIARTYENSYPSLVNVVGKRIVLTGKDNKCLVSSSDHNYRGITHNNFQVSSLDFGQSSAYLIGINQSNKIIGVTDVNGIIIIATDVGIFRVSGSNRIEPPNAVSAFVSRVSNQVLSNFRCITSANNQVFFCNRNGLFVLEYQKNIEETASTDISLPVANLFSQEPSVITYSDTHQSLLVEFASQKTKLLRLDLLTNAYSYVQTSVSNNTRIMGNFDGFWSESASGLVVCFWNRESTSDFENLENFVPSATYSPIGLTASVTTSNTNTSLLATPPELIQSLAGTGVVVPGYGYGFSRAVGSTVVVTEANNLKQAKPIISNFVTKDLYTDKLTRGLRIRNLSVVLSGNGVSNISIVPSSYVAQQSNSIYTLTLNSNGTYSIANATVKGSNSQRWLAGDSAVIQLEDFENTEAFRLAGSLTSSLEFIGFGFDVSSKQTKLK